MPFQVVLIFCLVQLNIILLLLLRCCLHKNQKAFQIIILGTSYTLFHRKIILGMLSNFKTFILRIVVYNFSSFSGRIWFLKHSLLLISIIIRYDVKRLKLENIMFLVVGKSIPKYSSRNTQFTDLNPCVTHPE